MATKSSKDFETCVELPGWKAKDGSQGCNGSLKIKLTYKDKKDFRSVDLKKSKGKLLTLSITGTVRFGINKGEAGGQCVSEVREIWGHIPEVAELCDLWERWHLNDLVSGTRKQMEVIRRLEKGPSLDWYDWACAQLALRDLLVDQGYTFGHEWLYEKIPAKVVARIKTLAEEI